MERSPFVWLRFALRWCTTLLTDFRSEFRPIDSMQPTFLTCLTSVQRKHCFDDGESASGLWLCFGWGFWFGWFWLPFGVCLRSFPHHHVVFPFLSMMTWALRPHGVRTRGKKYNPYNDQTTHRSRALCIGTPTKGVNMVPFNRGFTRGDRWPGSRDQGEAVRVEFFGQRCRSRFTLQRAALVTSADRNDQTCIVLQMRFREE